LAKNKNLLKKFGQKSPFLRNLVKILKEFIQKNQNFEEISSNKKILLEEIWSKVKIKKYN